MTKFDLYIEDNESIPDIEFVVSGGSAPIGYTKTNTIEAWHEHGHKLFDNYDPFKGETVNFKDWKCLQREIEHIADGICLNDYDANWNNFSESEKLILPKYVITKVTPLNLFLTYPDSTERLAISKKYDHNNIEARKLRVEQVRMHLFNKVSGGDALAVLDDANNEGLIRKYEDGIKSLATQGRIGLVDFIKSLNDYDGNGSMDGFSMRSYSVIDGSGDTLSDVANQLCDIIDNGLY